ncbi:MAG: hypothetical protein JSR73_06785 [Proteobacteria bacterium]|nr:hypothetical protein [Pseudomonadota bacterium]
MIAATAASAADRPPINVVTPATPSRWSAVVGGLVQLVDPWGDSDKATLLKRMAKEDRFDLAKHAQQRVLEALANRGRVALPLDVVRPPELSPGPLARERLPVAAVPGQMLDVAIEWFGLYRSGALESYRPMVAVSYRVLSATGQLEQSTRRVLYHVPSSVATGGEALAAEGDCAWKSFDELPRERARLWGCMDAALEKVADRIGTHVEGP